MIVDAAIIAVVGFFVWRGWRRGIIATLAGFAGFVVAVIVSVFGFRVIASPLEAAGTSEGIANLVGALVVFFGVLLGATVAGRVLTRALRTTKWGTVNAAAGGALSGAWALSMVTVALLAVTVVPVSSGLASEVEHSAIGRAIVDEAPAWMDSIARTDLRTMLRFFLPEQQKVAIVATTDFRRDEAAERWLFELVNAERRARDLPLLVWDESLARIARAHAAEMYRFGFFSHASPITGGPAQRYRRARISFASAGENLALAPSITSVHASLMASSRHRVHILDERFARAGLGVMRGRQGLLVAQNFAG